VTQHGCSFSDHLGIDGESLASRLPPLLHHTQLAVVGGGPAGLRAAEVAASAGLQVTLYDAKPSVGRKFLVAGKGGLNLTHGEGFDSFVSRYIGPDQPAGIWRDLVGDFGSEHLRGWATGLGVETFQASSGRVYPRRLWTWSGGSLLCFD
jgi:predicted flavoprotein YhiN